MVNHLHTLLLLIVTGLTANRGEAASASPPELPDEFREPSLRQYQQLELALYNALLRKDLKALTGLYQLGHHADGLQWASSPLGWGEIWLNPDTPGRLFVQVPHRFHDLNTETIGRHWLQAGISLLMLNSVHRHTRSAPTYVANSDFSHIRFNPMLAATRALVARDEPFLVIQLHGFNPALRRTEMARNSDVILSFGDHLSTAARRQLKESARCIRQQVGMRVSLYPDEVSELGGTRNIIGRNLRNLGYREHFLHVELGPAARDSLSENANLAQQLLTCLAGNLR